MNLLTYMLCKFAAILTGAITASITTGNYKFMLVLLILIPSFFGDIIRIIVAKGEWVEESKDETE